MTTTTTVPLIPSPTASDTTPADLAELVSLALSGHPWTARLSGQVETPNGGAGDSVGVFELVPGHDPLDLETEIVRRCGVGPDGRARDIRVMLRARASTGRFSSWVRVRMPVEVVTAMLGSPTPGRQSHVAAEAAGTAALKAEIEALRQQLAAPSRHTIVDQSPWEMARQMMQMQTEASRAMREELRALQSERTTPTATAPVEIYQQLGELKATVALGARAAEPATSTLQGIAAIAGALPLGDAMKMFGELIAIRRDESQMRMAMWAKQNNVPLIEEGTDPKETP